MKQPRRGRVPGAQRELFPSSDDAPPERFLFDGNRQVLIRVIEHRDGQKTRSEIPASQTLVDGSADLASAFDLAWLRAKDLPEPTANLPMLRVADLFSGCGGMTLGIREACRALAAGFDAAFANDIDSTALEVYAANFPSAVTASDSIETLLDRDFGDEISEREVELLQQIGKIDILLGGPPCQGHSNLNNHTRRTDDRNRLFLKMARFAELFRPDHIIIENVLGVRHDEHGVFDRTWHDLKKLGYSVDGHIVRAEQIGIAQRRPRVLMLASACRSVSIDDMLAEFRQPTRNFMWACSDLLDIASDSRLDEAPRALPVTQARINYLFDKNLYDLPDSERPDCHKLKPHTYKTVYGRIHPDQPAPTITTGFMTMGRGRFVHPVKRRTLTAHEAARLQFLPDGFQFGDRMRETYLRLIGNAVPSKMSYVAGVYLMR